MVPSQALSPIGRVTFTVHLVVAVIVGLTLLLVPFTFGKLFGYPTVPGIEPPLRAFGAMILGFGGVTSLYGILSKKWWRVDYIVRGEIVFLALQALVFIVSTILGSGPLLGNLVLAVVSLVLLALFLVTFITQPK
jgi:hypothetical protein